MSFTDRVAGLTEEQVEALTRAALWYANYFAREIAGEAGQTHASAVDDRHDYLALVEGLRVLGVRFALPDELQEHLPQAA